MIDKKKVLRRRYKHTDFWLRMKFQILGLTVLAILGLAGCDNSSDIDDEGGVVGTGIILRGTASENRTIASNEIQIKAQTGERSIAAILESSRYLAESVGGQGPWLLRSNLGSGNFRYGIAFSEERANIHSYTDVLLRNWFAQSDQDIDLLFDSDGSVLGLPDREQFLALSERFFALVKLVLESYFVSGEQLLIGDFDADNTGIDRYLDRNPVVIEGNNIRILLTEADSDRQSTTGSFLALDTDLAAADLEAPQTPTNIRVLGSATDQTVIVWEPAVDNIGVASYEVYRDGALIDTTPYPVFTDTALQTATSYSYELVAIDASGNPSNRSTAVTGSTLSQADTQAPPAPTELILRLTSTNRIEFIIRQTAIGDVTSFRIFRGTSSDSPQLLLELTSNFVADNTVSAGLSYCYQASAVDASGLESLRSDELCVVADDANVEVPGDGPGVPALAGLTLPDTLTIECSTSLPQTVGSQNTILSESCYLVEQDVVLDKFVNLTLSAGTVLKFAEGTRIQVGEGASLTSNGLPDSPVVLTGQQPFSGFWEGVEFNRSNHPSNLIRNTVIEYAGGGEIEGGLKVVSSVGARSRIQVENSLFRFSARYGVSFASLGTVLDKFEGNLVTENRWPAAINLESLDAFTGTNDFTGNVEREEIDVSRLSTAKDILIPDIGVPYRSGGMVLEQAKLTLAAGVEMKFLNNSQIKVDGEIVSRGTLDKPVILTSWQERLPGQWVGLILSNSKTSVLQHTTIEFAGGSADSDVGDAQSGAVKLVCSADSPARISIADSSFISSASWGIFRDQLDGCDIDLGENVQFGSNALGDINIQ